MSNRSHKQLSDVELQKRRTELIALCRNPRHRRSGGALKHPSKWWPERVTNPESGMVFTDSGAWHLIADELERGAELQTITLHTPAKKTGYVMLIFLEERQPELYVKLQLSGGRAWGRSFHYSDPKGGGSSE